MFCYFLMVRLPPRSTLTDTLFPCTTLFRSRPTIATGCRSDDELVQEEVFGPVLTVQIAEDAAHALALANDSQYALVAGIYTTNFSAAHRLAQRLNAGQVYINEYFAGGIEVPFGGNKNSGFGREKGLGGLLSYCRTQSVAARKLGRASGRAEECQDVI